MTMVEELKETYKEMVVQMNKKLDKIVKQLENAILEDKEARSETLVAVKELSVHVNHENGLMDTRIKYLEKCEADKVILEKRNKKNIKLGKIGVGVFVIAIAVLILHFIGILW